MYAVLRVLILAMLGRSRSSCVCGPAPFRVDSLGAGIKIGTIDAARELLGPCKPCCCVSAEITSFLFSKDLK